MTVVPHQKDVFSIALFGAPSVGKTSALAAYVGHTKPDWIDAADEDTSKTITSLLHKWNRFARNQFPPSTVNVEPHKLRHKPTGRRIELRDVRGGGAVALDPIDTVALETSDVGIYFVSWPSGDAEPLVALNNALLKAKDKPAALVLTKVEAHLRAEEVGLFLYDPASAARKYRFPRLLIDAIEGKCRGHVYPISVFGYRRDGLPAHFIDEFGRSLPWGVSPLHVNLPFDDMIGMMP
jgi:hypothetical protein